MKRILVVDDEEKIRRVIREYAEAYGFNVSEAKDGIEAIDIVKKQSFDIIIMDIMMPKMDGFSACKEIREIKDIPILMLSARGEEYDKLLGFNLGIDDYVVKPFSPKELMARVNAIIKRNNHEISEEIYKIDGLTINRTAREVILDGEKIPMTPKEYELLFYMIKNKNIALSRDKILNNVWGIDFFGEERTVDTHIKMLRNSLGKYRDYIVTVRGMGYKFEVQEDGREN